MPVSSCFGGHLEFMAPTWKYSLANVAPYLKSIGIVQRLFVPKFMLLPKSAQFTFFVTNLLDYGETVDGKTILVNIVACPYNMALKMRFVVIVHNFLVIVLDYHDNNY